ncbi:hypothetical protein [Gemmata palustris]|uniref:hypothetical protein n=1 Tax=Gemmata palustris TaxID=2822762 RepID=UPI001FE31A56|nr:hypothetical protein [Gemmata palustris]
MTEAEWLSATDPAPMLDFLRGKASDRKLRLFTVGCCRRLWRYLDDKHWRPALEAAEQCADGELSVEELSACWGDGRLMDDDFAARNGFSLQIVRAAFTTVWRSLHVTEKEKNTAAYVALIAGAQALGRKADEFLLYHLHFRLVELDEEEHHKADLVVSAEKSVLAAFLRDIFGNPFRRTINFKDTWRTNTVIALARQMYENRDFSPMPILADALQDAGCDDEDVLSHCRGDGPHVRGCWVVDLLLGKK